MPIPEKTNWNNKAFSGFKSGFRAASIFGRGSAANGKKRGKQRSSEVSPTVSSLRQNRKNRAFRNFISRINPKNIRLPFRNGGTRNLRGTSSTSIGGRGLKSAQSKTKPVVQINAKYKRKYNLIFKAFNAVVAEIKYIFMIIVGALLIVFIYMLTQTSFFKVKEVQFDGVDKLDQSSLSQIASRYKGKNIYLVNLSQIEKDVAGSSVYIKSVYAKKELPSRIVISIKERYPNFTLASLDGVYLVDKDNVVIAKPVDKSVNFTDEEWQAYYTQDVNLEIVKNRVKVNLEKETSSHTTGTTNTSTTANSKGKIDSQYLDAQGNFDYTKVPDKLKVNALNEIKKQMDDIIAQHFKELNQQMNSADYAGLTRIYIYQNTDYKEGKKIDNKLLDCTTAAVDYLNQNEKFHITEIIWQTEFTFRIQTVEKKQFYFGINRDINAQIYDLDVVIKYLEEHKQNYKVIDVRTEKVAVKN